MKKIIIILILAISVSTFAQTGIGTTTPNANAQLEVASTTKGFLPPRVALTSTTSASPLAVHVTGMVVYNTATAGDVTPGLYVNNGAAWVKSAGGATALNDLTDSKTGDYSSNNSIYLGGYTGYSQSTTSTGDNNFAIGHYSLIKSSGSDNIALGASALQQNTSGASNVGVGGSSLLANATGSANTAIGSGALNYNSSGGANTAIGASALQRNLGSYNTAAGYQALRYLSTGDNNVALGKFAGFNNTTGNLTIAANSIFIGSDSTAKNNNTTNEIVIGASAIGNGSNTVTLGNTLITDSYLGGTIHSSSGLSLSYVAKTTTYTILASDYTVDCTGTFTITLPSSVGIGGRIYIIKNSGSGTITIACAGAETIDGSTTKTMSTQYGVTKVQSTGANWIVI
jgi:hypothetical protein